MAISLSLDSIRGCVFEDELVSSEDEDDDEDEAKQNRESDCLPTEAPPKIGASEMNQQLKELEVVFREMHTEEDSVTFFQGVKAKKKKQKPTRNFVHQTLEPQPEMHRPWSPVVEDNGFNVGRDHWKPLQSNQWKPVSNNNNEFFINKKDFPALGK